MDDEIPKLRTRITQLEDEVFWLKRENKRLQQNHATPFFWTCLFVCVLFVIFGMRCR